MYYLNSRYYPEIGRFINADDVNYLELGSFDGLNLYAYCGNNPVMMVDPSGEFGLLATLLISTVVGGLISGGIEIGKQLISNDFDINNLNWYDIGASALSGAATGFAYGLGGVAGGIIKGSMTAIKGLTAAQSVGVLLGTAVVSNFVAGMGVYSLRVAGDNNKEFNGLNMIKAGLGQSAKGVTSFYFGGMMVGSGFWNVGTRGKNTINPIIRGISKSPSTFVPYKIIDDTLFSY